jgi:hypothetical protein
MSAQIEVLKRFSFPLSPAGIVIGYVLTLFAVVAGVVAFPFSIISMVLLFIVVGAFFVLAITVLLMTYLFFTIAFSRAMLALSRRLLFGSDPNNESQRSSKPSRMEKDLAPEQTDIGLWDRWIDGM